MPVKQLLESCKAIQLKPKLSEEEMREFQGSLPGPIPTDIEELLRYSSGFKINSIEVDFTGRSYRFEFKELVPYGVPVAKTEEGNFWVVDVGENGIWSSLFHISFDPPILLVQYSTLEGFVEAALSGQLAATREFLRTKGAYSAGILADQARNSPDSVIAQFAQSLPSNSRIFDLRGDTVPQGFEWGSAGPRSMCKRFGCELIFATEEPTARKGLLSRLLAK
ncbi:MAG: hypothetical protein CAF43_001690 [Nitrospira sp. CG24C]|jgi:hypothetical protein|nr:MAG: hypothetical protein CAF43_001690 [Nitrospira sp. CG24C]